MTTEPPKNSASEQRWGEFTRLILPATTALREHVGIDEETFRTHTFHGFPREFFLWSALDEAMKACVFVMKLDGLLDGELPRPDPAEAHPADRAIEALLLEEDHLRVRRLCEVLVQLVLFAKQDRRELYMHFLLLEDLVRAAAYNSELVDFHGAPSAWVDFTVQRLLTELHQLETQVTPADAWYAKPHKRPVRAADWRGLLSTARARLIQAFPLMTDVERLTLGATYGEAFGAPSETIHYKSGNDPVSHFSRSTVEPEGTKVCVMALCVVRRVHQLLGSPADPLLDSIATALDANKESARLLELLLSRSAVEAGDFVLARGYFGQVIEERVSKFGYRSLRVELLAERPLPDLGDDWFRVRDVVRVFSKAQLVQRIRSTTRNPTLEVPNEVLRLSAVEAWKLGLREDVRRAAKRSRNR